MSFERSPVMKERFPDVKGSTVRGVLIYIITNNPIVIVTGKSFEEQEFEVLNKNFTK